MLHLPTRLPPGALVGGEERVLTQHLQRSGGARFVARASDILLEEGRIIGWREARGAVVAEPSGPNSGNSRFDAGPPGALLCIEGRNCGFTLPGFAPKVEAFTAAIRFQSSGQARTLLSVSTGQANNMIYLTEVDGRLTAQDRSGTVSVALAEQPVDALKCAILSFDGRRLRLSSGRQSKSATAQIPGLDHPADFFIGCRSNRPGLQKTLGESHILEVLFWPDRALLGSDDAAECDMLAALDRYLRWQW